jgi:nitrogen regulatory protein PII
MSPLKKLHLVTAVVQHKLGNQVIQAALGAGAAGATYIHGMGTGVRQGLGAQGEEIEADKRIILVIVPAAKTDAVLAAVVSSGGLDRPGQGVAYVQDVIRAVGF